MSTIVAISTAIGNSGIGIIRMSGEESFEIIKKIFKNKSKEIDIKPNTIKYGYIVDRDNIIDEVLVSFFKAPKSFTKENMCEINSHGGTIVMKKILEVCLKNGAELAEPGEFTKRAFLNGRIDLSQAEAIIDVINAKTEKQVKTSMKQLSGELSEILKEIRNEVMSILVDIEASIDYPEYDVEDVTNEKILKTLNTIEEKLNKLEKTFYNGRIIKEGIKIAIIGRPNAGKSSLLNAMLKEERAIVTDIEGTTRDTIEEFIQVNGIPIKIIDTAGIRKTDNTIEQIGINKSIDVANNADLIIAIFDSSKKLQDEDEKILKLIQDKKGIILLNKMDKKAEICEEKIKVEMGDKAIIKISAMNKIGIDKIYDEISRLYELNEVDIDDSLTITNERHKQAIRNMNEFIHKSKDAMNQRMPIDIIEVNITNILEEIGKITGESISEDIISEIFKKFCLGK